MTKRFQVTPASAGYGSRVWVGIPDDGTTDMYRGSDLYQTFRELCMWGGHDKSGDNFIAFEFSARNPENHARAVDLLEKAGYVNDQSYWLSY